MSHPPAVLRLRRAVLVVSLAAGLPAISSNWGPSRPVSEGETAVALVREAYGRLPLAFEANRGQVGPEVRFRARTGSSEVLLGPGGAILHTAAGSLTMKLVGARREPAMTGENPLPGTVNYLHGRDPSAWTTGIPTFGRVGYQDVYPGVDVLWYGNGKNLEYDVVVAPHADPGRVRLSLDGATALRLDRDGDLVVAMPGGEIRQRPPRIYQRVAGGGEEPVAGRYVLDGNDVRFAVGTYDRTRTLVIDPVIEYSTTLGGSGGEFAGDIVLDSAGNAYVTGGTNSVAWEMPEMSYPGDFPNTYPLPTGQITPAQGSDDVFVTKINPAGTAVVYSTYWGGTAADQGHGVAVDAGGSAYVTGYTYSADFPTVAPVQPSLAGGFDAFVSKLNPAGDSLVYSTFLGGSGDEEAYAVAVDVQNRAHVVGTTKSANFPVASALQPTLAGFWGNRDAFLTRVSANGTALEVSTYLGGGGDEYAYDVELDPTGRPHLTGLTSSADFPTAQAMQPAFAGYSDAFVTTLDASETSLVSSTYLGGNYADQAGGLALDGAGCTYVTGGTRSQDFTVVNAFQPTLHGQVNAFLTKLCPGGSGPVYSTYLGRGSENFDDIGDVAVDSAGSAYVIGSTRSSDFPTLHPVQAAFAGASDAFVTKVGPTGTMPVYSTYLGGPGFDWGRRIAVDGLGRAHVTGFASGGFPRVNPLQPEQGGGDVFVARIGPEGLTPQPPAGLGLAWGNGETGELGDSGTADSAVPVLPKHTPDLIAIAAGRQHSLAVRSDGSVIAWGSNDDGALGDGTTTSAQGPIPVPNLDSGFVGVAAGDRFSIALKADGTVVGWGANDRGQLGNGGTGPALSPTPVSGLTGVVAISAGIAHGLALRWDGSVYAWGWNEYGQLGTNGTADSALPVAVATLGSGVAGIAAGGTHSLAVKASGAVLAWGANKEGQLGTNSTVGSLVPIGVSGLSSGVVAVAGGGTHSLALTSAGAVKAWGANGDGQLGSNAQTGGSLVPVAVGGLASGVTKVAAGDTHNLAIGAGGAVLAWGGGSQGELGNGAVAASAAPVQVVGLGTGALAIAAGGAHSLAIASAAHIPQTITFLTPSTGVATTSAVLQAGAGASGNPLVFSVHPSSGAGVCTVSGLNGVTVNFAIGGTCVVAANQAGDNAYDPAPTVTRTLPVAKANQTITFPAIANKTLAQSPATVSATASSGLTVTISSSTAAVCTAGGTAGTTITLVTAGTCTLKATQVGNPAYNAAPAVLRSFTVTKVSQTIAFPPMANKTLAQSPATATATASSGLIVTFTTSTPAVCTASGTSGATISLLAAGTCSVKANQPGNTTYAAAAIVTRQFTVTN